MATKILWNDYLNQITNDIALYERNREHSIVFKDDDLRVELWDFFTKLRTATSTSLALNQILFAAVTSVNAKTAEWAREQIQKQVDLFRAYKTDAQRLLDRLPK